MTFKLKLLLLLNLFLFSIITHAATIKIATLTPDGTALMKSMRSAAKEILKVTDGRVELKFYPGGVMGNETAILRKMRINQLQGAIISSGSLDNTYSDVSIYGMPFLFNSHKEALYVREKMDHLILEGLEKGGLTSYGIAESGFAYILSNNPVKSIFDLRKQTFWVPDNASARNAAKVFKLQPIPLPFGDVLAGLQTNLVNAIAVSPIAAIALQWHTQVKYLTDMPLLYGWGTLVISERALKKLTAPDKKLIHDILSEEFKKIDLENRKDNIAALSALKNQGIKFIQPNQQQLSEWRKLAQEGNSELVNKGYNSKEMYNLINKHIADFQKLK